MTFWILVAALLALALILLLLPLLRGSGKALEDQRQQQNVRIAQEKKAQLDSQLAAGELDQAGYDAAYAELQASLALELERAEAGGEDRRGKWMAPIVLLAIPCASIAMYLVYGEYRVIQNPQLVEAAQPTDQAPQMSLPEMVAVIENRLSENPEDVEAWFMLGRARMAGQEFDAAVTAFRRSNELMQNEPGIMFALADAIAMQNNGSMQGEPEALVQRGLQIAPRFPNGLWLAGMAAEQRGDFASAHRYWSLLLPQLGSNPQSAAEVREMLASLEMRDPSLAAPAVSSAGALEVAVDISDELRGRASPDTAVFVYAKAMQGPPMPLAVKRLQLRDLPTRLSLSDGDAMMPGLTLSSFDQVVVGARVSFSGNPVAQAGDFYTEQDGIDSRQPPAEISLVIDSVK